MKNKRAWHFLAGTNRPVLRDGRPLVTGRWLQHEGEVSVCRSGLHASYNILDALSYAPGTWVSRVEVRRVEAVQDDKLVCRSRKALWCYNAKAELGLFAREQAKGVLHLWDAPEVVKNYLETGDESIRTAARAARAAAGDAAEKRLELIVTNGARERGLV